jgi:hypothetical protein
MKEMAQTMRSCRINRLFCVAMLVIEVRLSCCCLFGQEIDESRPTSPLTIEQTGRDAQLLISVLRGIHPGYMRYRTAADVTAAEQAFLAAATDARNTGEMYLTVSKFLAAIRCEHTEAELPPQMLEWRNKHASMLPVAFAWIGGKAIVTGVAPEVTGILAGDELIEVDGRPMQGLYEATIPYISVDGFTDYTKASIFSGSDDIGLTTFDVFHPLMHGFSSSFGLSVRGTDGHLRQTRVSAVGTEVSNAARGIGRAQSNFSDKAAVSWSRVGNTAVLNINTFVNYRTPIDPESVFGPVFREIGDSGVDRLVLDFRSVGGGSDDVMNSLLRHLIDKPITVGGPSRVKTYQFDAFRRYLSTWDENVFNMPASLFVEDDTGMYTVSPEVTGGTRQVEPAPDAWKGSLTVLIGPNNESGATVLLAELRDERTATLVGESTGGSAEGPTGGVIAFLSLPESTIRVRVPLLWTTTSYKAFTPGKGIEPDIVVEKTIEDIRTGRDRVLEVATKRE